MMCTFLCEYDNCNYKQLLKIISLLKYMFYFYQSQSSIVSNNFSHCILRNYTHHCVMGMGSVLWKTKKNRIVLHVIDLSSKLLPTSNCICTAFYSMYISGAFNLFYLFNKCYPMSITGIIKISVASNI